MCLSIVLFNGRAPYSRSYPCSTSLFIAFDLTSNQIPCSESRFATKAISISAIDLISFSVNGSKTTI